MPLKPGERVAAVVLLLPVFGLESQPFAMPRAGAGEAHFRFHANDLGKVAFAGERLASEPGGLRLERYGRSILFRKLPGQ